MGLLVREEGFGEIEVMSNGTIFVELADGSSVHLEPIDSPDVEALVSDIRSKFHKLNGVIKDHINQLEEVHGETSWNGYPDSTCSGICQ